MIDQIYLLICRKCGCTIEIGLCGFGCPLDDIVESKREPEDMEIRVFTLSRTDPYTPDFRKTTPELSKETAE